MLKQKLTVFIILLFASLTLAKIDLQISNQELTLGLSCAAWQESGQFVDFFNSTVELNHQWINRTFLDVLLNATYRERLQMAMGVEGKMWFNIPKLRGTGQATYVHEQNSTFIISDANASYSFGNMQAPFLSAKIGLFPYKYDQEARNLGEYLFRTGTYPAYIINNFDLPFARLTGLKISSDLFGGLHQDLILSAETTIPPFNDVSLTYIADYNLRKIFDVGLGVQFADLISVDERVTTPHLAKNQYVTANGDTGYYTFRGTKLMAKICFDPKQFFPLDIFGKEDGKLYTEATVLGVESYPRNDSVTLLSPGTGSGKNYWGYDSIKNKIPIMFGFNIPTFKILDVFAIEGEWYGCPYPNSFQNRLGPGATTSYPVPDNPVHLNFANYASDNWKWSVYAKKTFFNEHLGLVLQLSRDHSRNETLINESYDYEEAMSLNKQWMWMAKVVAQF
jgi:hypothetical protein